MNVTKRLIAVGIVLGLGIVALVIRVRSSSPADEVPTVTAEETTVSAPFTPSTVVASVPVATTIYNTTSTTTENLSTTITDALPGLTVHRLPVFYGSAPLGGSPIVVPLAWSGEPINAKVIAARPNDPNFVVADLVEGVVRIYTPSSHNQQGYSINSAVLTAQGDALVALGGKSAEVFVIPDADFSKPSTRLVLSRIAITSSGEFSELYALADRSSSWVWILQTTDDEDEGDVGETWIDLVSIESGETVMTADLEGKYTLGGIIDNGLVLVGYRKNPVTYLILERDGAVHPIPLKLTGGSVDGHGGFTTVAAHGRHIALLSRDLQEMVIVDAETKVVQRITKPSEGLWTPNGIPSVPVDPYRATPTDEFVVGFRATTGAWSLHAISLGNGSIRELGEYPTPQPESDKFRRKPVFRAEIASDGETILAFKGSQIYVVNDTGDLLPVVGLPDDHFVFDAA